jgi:hypothetical protein
MADPIWTVISAETDLKPWTAVAATRAGAEAGRWPAVTGWGVPATLTRAGRIWW